MKKPSETLGSEKTAIGHSLFPFSQPTCNAIKKKHAGQDKDKGDNYPRLWEKHKVQSLPKHDILLT